MKLKIIVVIAGIMLLAPYSVYAAACQTHCETNQFQCDDCECVNSQTLCKRESEIEDGGGGSGNGGGGNNGGDGDGGCTTDADCSTNQYCDTSNGTCEQCTGCTSCVSDSDYSSAETGYEKKVNRTCSCNTCNEVISYQCAAGYYGRPRGTNGAPSGCTQCPDQGQSAAGSIQITQCYLHSFKDSIGEGVYTQDCYYTNDPV